MIQLYNSNIQLGPITTLWQRRLTTSFIFDVHGQDSSPSSVMLIINCSHHFGYRLWGTRINFRTHLYLNRTLVLFQVTFVTECSKEQTCTNADLGKNRIFNAIKDQPKLKTDDACIIQWTAQAYMVKEMVVISQFLTVEHVH